jgi:hypothetical protein
MRCGWCCTPVALSLCIVLEYASSLWYNVEVSKIIIDKAVLLLDLIFTLFPPNISEGSILNLVQARMLAT